MHNRRYTVPPLDPLLAFEAAARNLSFTKAAAELNLTQSAVSRQIQQLELHLGVKLFERRTRTLLLTENGQLFYRCTTRRGASRALPPRPTRSSWPRRRALRRYG
jgi:LysR family glycine cleavage system transcriptional activator